MLDPKPTDVILSTHPVEKSGWLRKNVVDKVRNAAGDVPVEHIVVEVGEEGGSTNVLVIANETVVGDALLARIRERAARGPTSLIISVRPEPSSHPEADCRLRRALSELRGAGIEAHGQVAHPDPYTAAMQAIEDERVDEVIVSTSAGRIAVAAEESRPAAGKRRASRSSTSISAEEVGAEPAQT